MGALSSEASISVAKHSRERAPVIGRHHRKRLRRNGAVVVELQRIIPIVSDGAVNLMCGAGQRPESLRWSWLWPWRFRDRPSCRHRARAAACQASRPADLKIAIHLRTVMMHTLEAADRPAELDALLA